MSLRRFFIAPEDIAGKEAVLRGEEAHHLGRVLRLAPGDAITLFDGSGKRYQARLQEITSSRAVATILADELEPPPPVRLQLAQGLLKGQKMDLVLQKGTELGLSGIWPFFCEYSREQKKEGRGKEERWQRIVLEACKQCDRALPPELHPPRSLTQLLAEPPACDLKLIFWEQEQEQDLAGLLARQKQRIASALFLIGPEGGFAPREAAAALEQGFLPVSLGPRLLRAETASLAAAAILQFALGNLHRPPSPPAGEK
jgi:16S rRNA (uracil1498-N3)-methyltransferase